ncbi:MAG: response regulator transcription factor [Polyangiales bacterium]
MNARILFVEDDERLGAQVVAHLERAGFEPTWLRDGDAALRVEPREFGLIVLDLMLPGTFGLDVLKHLRAKCDVPVLVLSARDDASDKIRALRLGADDYVTKPFYPEELLERVRARLRRPQLARAGDAFRLPGLEVDLEARRVTTDEGAVELTRTEFEILAALCRRPGAAVARSALVAQALDESGGNERTLDVHVARLRKKLGGAGDRIATVWGIGYRLRTEEGAG